MPKFNFNNKSKKFQNYGVNDMNKFRYVISVVNFISVGFILLHIEVKNLKLILLCGSFNLGSGKNKSSKFSSRASTFD